MQGQIVQAASKQFLDLGYGLKKSTASLESKYKNLITPSNLVNATSSSKTDLCSKDESLLKKQLNDIIVQLQVSTKIINSILSVLNKLIGFLDVVQIAITGLLAISEILKFIPVTFGVPAIRLSDLLAKINAQLQVSYIIITGMDVTVKFLAGFLSIIFIQLNDLINKLRLSSSQLKDCQPVLSDTLNTNLDNLDQSIQNLNNKIGTLIKNDNNYKGFTFQIIEEQTTTQVITKRRYAVAINSSGIVTLQGELSYATDTQVLIDELKLQIDNKHLTGYTN